MPKYISYLDLQDFAASVLKRHEANSLFENSRTGFLKMLKIPHCAGNQYWLITEEWDELVENSPIATLENPNPQQVRGLVRRKQNMVIAMHPVAHAVVQQASGKSDYVLSNSLLIKRELYDWVISLNQQVRQAQEGSSNGNGLESELRAAVEDSSTATESSGTDSGVQISPDAPLES